MAKKARKKARRKRAKGKVLIGGNYEAASTPGCHIAHTTAEWILWSGSFDREEFGLTDSSKVPDISIDPEDGVLTVINPTKVPRAYYITLENGTRAFDKKDKLLSMGSHRTTNTSTMLCTTFILTLPPEYTMDVCRLDLPEGGPQAVPISSDISDLKSDKLPNIERSIKIAEEKKTKSLGFPLGGKGPYFCSQGIGGRFTHFYPGTRYAIDLECPVGTPILAVASGVVRDVQDNRKAGGIHISSLYQWNSISIELDDGTLVDYVHIRTGSARVSKGNRVSRGQLICESGDVGFCPRPHLHLQLTASPKPDADTIPFSFDGTVIPLAGSWYKNNGVCESNSIPNKAEWERKMLTMGTLAKQSLPNNVAELTYEYQQEDEKKRSSK